MFSAIAPCLSPRHSSSRVHHLVGSRDAFCILHWVSPGLNHCANLNGFDSRAQVTVGPRWDLRHPHAVTINLSCSMHPVDILNIGWRHAVSAAPSLRKQMPRPCEFLGGKCGQLSQREIARVSHHASALDPDVGVSGSGRLGLMRTEERTGGESVG